MQLEGNPPRPKLENIWGIRNLSKKKDGRHFRHIFVNSSLSVHIFVYVRYTNVEELSIMNNLIYYTRLLDN